MCRRADLPELVAAETPLGPNQAAARLRVRCTDFDHMLRLGWLTAAETVDVQFGTSRTGAVDVALYRTTDIDALPAAHPETDWEQLRAVRKGQRSPPRRPPTGDRLTAVAPAHRGHHRSPARHVHTTDDERRRAPEATARTPNNPPGSATPGTVIAKRERARASGRSRGWQQPR